MNDRPEPRKFRDVTIQDILPHAKRKCRACAGLGYFFKTVDGIRNHAPCGCAVRRFLKANAGSWALDSKKNLKVLAEVPERTVEELLAVAQTIDEQKASLAEEPPGELETP